MIHWKNIKNFEGLYLVSSNGKVKSLYKRIKFNVFAETILKPSTDLRGYLQVVMYKNGKRTTRRIHRLVASAFLDNPKNKRTVNHINKNKLDNNVNNLEWMTDFENINYSFAKKILQIKNNKVIREWLSASEAARSGYHQGHISECCRGKLKTHAGYKWKFK